MRRPGSRWSGAVAGLVLFTWLLGTSQIRRWLVCVTGADAPGVEGVAPLPWRAAYGFDAGSEWTDDGSTRERRQLKHRAEGDSRIVPTHPELTRLLREHLDKFGTAPDGRLFGGVRGGELPTITCRRAWIKARQTALSDAEQVSLLARRPYDLRHACLSTRLNGVYPTQVAEWAGHGVDVLLRIYAKCIVGQDELAKRRISEALCQD